MLTQFESATVGKASRGETILFEDFAGSKFPAKQCCAGLIDSGLQLETAQNCLDVMTLALLLRCV